MIALQYAQFGEPADVVAAAEIETPQPGANEVRLRVVRSPIHNHDLATIRGTYGTKPALPATAGSEVLGIVDAVGSAVQGVAIGARVAATTHGAWAQFAIAPAAGIVPMPDAIGDDVACQLLAMPMSAVVLFDELHVKSGDWIVQNAANGAVGTILMRIAQSKGVNVVNLVRRDAAVTELHALGAHHVVSTERAAWQTQVRAITENQPIVRAIDSITGAHSLDLQRLLGHSGELIVFGGLAGTAMKLDPSLMISNELVVRGFWMTAWMARATPQQRADAARRVYALAQSGNLPLPVAGTFPLSNSTEALKLAETPGRGGKVLFHL